MHRSGKQRSGQRIQVGPRSTPALAATEASDFGHPGWRVDTSSQIHDALLQQLRSEAISLISRRGPQMLHSDVLNLR